MLTRFGYECCNGLEEFKAWSQNFGHSRISTTVTSYGEIESYRQGEIIKNLSPNRSETTLNGLEEKIDLLLTKNNA